MYDQNTIIRNAILTPDGTYLRSYHRHDYKSHFDETTGETYVVDGGNDYLRRSLNIVPAEELSVYLSDSFEDKVRYAFVWKSYGKNFEHPEGIYIALCDMTDDHINNILRTQHHILGTYVEYLFKKEMVYRKSKRKVNDE